MKTNTSLKIIEFLKKNKEATATQISEFLGISYQGTFKQLNKLQVLNLIKKIGKPPFVFYLLNENIDLAVNTFDIDKKDIEIIEKNYIYFSPAGEVYDGVSGFIKWCESKKQDVIKTSQEYVKTISKYEKYKKGGFIDGMVKMRATFNSLGVDELYYFDFYSIERFGKTKLGALLLYAKQSQSVELINKIYEIIKDDFFKFLKNKDIDAVCFVPPTVSRKIQFQKELEKKLNIKLPHVRITKIVNQIPVPQKTLNKLEDRMENARSTIFIKEDNVFKNILIIDDGVGSGSTINEIALKIKNKGICSGKIIGLAITCSYNGFDVINEV